MQQPFPIGGHPFRILSMLAVWLLVSGCGATSATYSPAAAREISSLKSRSLRLMEKAEFPYGEHDKAIDRLREDLGGALARAEARKYNTATTRQWLLLLDPERHLLGGFLSRWQDEEFLHTAFIVEARLLVASAFDELTLHETKKNGAPK